LKARPLAVVLASAGAAATSAGAGGAGGGGAGGSGSMGLESAAAERQPNDTHAPVNTAAINHG